MLAWGVFLLVALVLRAPGFPASVLDPDEGLYIVQAAAWLQGGWPYVAVWDMHPPGAPAFFALAHAFIPDPIWAMRLLGVAAVTATAGGLRALALLLGAGPRVGLAAGLLYVAHTVVLGGLATNTEILFAPWVVLTAWLLLREALQAESPRALWVLAAGFAAGIALWIKQVTALELSALWLTMVVAAFVLGRLRPGRLPLLALAFAFGAGFPTLAMAAGYWAAGQIEPWLYGNIWAPLTYAAVDDVNVGLRVGLAMALPHLGWLAAAACGILAASPEARRPALLLLPWLFAALVEVVAPWKFFDHYFLILLPPLCLLAALGLGALVRRVVRRGYRNLVFPVLVAALAAMPVSAMLLPRIAHGLGLRIADPPRQVAALARSVLGPDETLYVPNWHPVTYALAGRMPPSRFAFPTHLAGFHASLTGVDAEAELARVLALPPGVIVIAPARWDAVRPDARAVIEAALASRYVLAGTVQDGTEEVQVWRRR